MNRADYEAVHGLILEETEKGTAGQTLSGYLYGLTTAWQRAERAGVVSGRNPFTKHKISLASKRPRGVFSYPEIYQLYSYCPAGELKVLIHAAATSGARINELLSSELKMMDGYLCWLFMFKKKGKTQGSTRIVPVHSSLEKDIDADYRFGTSYGKIQQQFMKLLEKVMGKPIDELTGQPRNLTFHSIRHAFSTELVSRLDVPMGKVAAITGHKAADNRYGSLNGYVHTQDLDVKRRTVEMIQWKKG